jgi:HK97 family phage prohead protease
MDTEYLPPFEVKELSEDGTFNGVASVYGVEDLGGDVIDKGAFTKTISENPTIPILWQHKKDEVIGEGSVKEWQGKIMLTGKLDMDDPVAQKVYSKMKKRMIRGLSIGYTTVKAAFAEVEGRTVRHIQELKLWETSIVTFPMLPSAQITRVKQAEEAKIKMLEEQLQGQGSKVRALEEQIQALQAKLATPAEPTSVTPEPAQVTEPQINQAEPVEDHSAAASLIDEMRSLIPA